MPHGYTGRILHVDLTAGTLTVETPQIVLPDVYGRFGYGVVLHPQEMPAGGDPLSPENVLTIFTGVTTGAQRQRSEPRQPERQIAHQRCRWRFAGRRLLPRQRSKFAGFDGGVVKGRSPRPVYTPWLKDGVAETASTAIAPDRQSDRRSRARSSNRNWAMTKSKSLQHGPSGRERARPCSPARSACPTATTDARAWGW